MGKIKLKTLEFSTSSSESAFEGEGREEETQRQGEGEEEREGERSNEIKSLWEEYLRAGFYEGTSLEQAWFGHGRGNSRALNSSPTLFLTLGATAAGEGGGDSLGRGREHQTDAGTWGSGCWQPEPTRGAGSQLRVI